MGLQNTVFSNLKLTFTVNFVVSVLTRNFEEEPRISQKLKEPTYTTKNTPSSHQEKLNKIKDIQFVSWQIIQDS